ncbi:MAG: CatB-related O-acetyltransferase [Clostridia bacterium]|nr:CatB-related O-acetyltransferase [Clostridia bacterium]
MIKRKVGALFYYTIAKKLPASYSGIKVGQTLLRRLCGKLMLKKCGKGVNIEKNASFSYKVSLGDYSGLGVNSKIYGSCTIGDYVMMGEDVTVITRNHKNDSVDIPMLKQGFDEEKPVVIGNDVWIGDRVIILPGVEIGDGCIIGAGSVVTKSVPPYCVAAGVPCKIIKQRK